MFQCFNHKYIVEIVDSVRLILSAIVIVIFFLLVSCKSPQFYLLKGYLRTVVSTPCFIPIDVYSSFND